MGSLFKYFCIFLMNLLNCTNHPSYFNTNTNRFGQRLFRSAQTEWNNADNTRRATQSTEHFQASRFCYAVHFSLVALGLDAEVDDARLQDNSRFVNDGGVRLGNSRALSITVTVIYIQQTEPWIQNHRLGWIIKQIVSPLKAKCHLWSVHRNIWHQDATCLRAGTAYCRRWLY